MRIGDFCIREAIECSRSTPALEWAQMTGNSRVGDVVRISHGDDHRVRP